MTLYLWIKIFKFFGFLRWTTITVYELSLKTRSRNISWLKINLISIFSRRLLKIKISRNRRAIQITIHHLNWKKILIHQKLKTNLQSLKSLECSSYNLVLFNSIAHQLISLDLKKADKNKHQKPRALRDCNPLKLRGQNVTPTKTKAKTMATARLQPDWN